VRPLLVIAAGLVLTVLVATGVTLTVLHLQSRTNPQQVNLGSHVTITEDSAIVQAAAKARPAVVSVVTQQHPVLRGSGYLATSDGFIVTNIDVIAGASSMTVLVPGDATLHQARLVDYDCQTGVAVIKIDQVSGLPTLAFADPTSFVQGQAIVAIGGPYDGGAVTPAYISAMHQVVLVPDPVTAGHTLQLSDAIQTNALIDSGTSGGPLVNVGGQVIGIAVQAPALSGRGGFGLNVADLTDDVNQMIQTGKLTVPSIGATTIEIPTESAALAGLPGGTQVVTVEPGGPTAAAGLQPGDVITQIDDVNLDSAHPLDLLLRSQFHANQRVTVTYSRGGASTQAQLTLVAAHPSCS